MFNNISFQNSSIILILNRLSALKKGTETHFHNAKIHIFPDMGKKTSFLGMFNGLPRMSPPRGHGRYFLCSITLFH